MIRFQGFRLCLCSRAWLSIFFVQTQQTHEYKKCISRHPTSPIKHPFLPVLFAIWKKKKEFLRPFFGAHLGNLLSFKLIIRLMELRLWWIFYRKKPFKTTGTWALGPSSWPRGAYLGWPCIGSEPTWRVFRKKTCLKKIMFLTIVDSHLEICLFVCENLCSPQLHTLDSRHLDSANHLLHLRLNFIQEPNHRTVWRVGISDQGLGSPRWDISKMHHVEVVFCLQ